MIVEAVAAVALVHGCGWGATPSKVGCLTPFAACRQAHARAYRRHGYACVDGHLRYDWSLLRRRPVRRPACVTTRQQGGLEANGYPTVPAWGPGPAWPFIPLKSLDVPVEYDHGFYAEWGVFKAMWAIDPRYVGPVLVRGRQLDGDEILRFEKGEPGFSDQTAANPAAELQEAGGYVHPAVTRVRTLGCYAYQVDGVGFSYSIVFHAVAK
jgi:hypothetical protein